MTGGEDRLAKKRINQLAWNTQPGENSNLSKVETGTDSAGLQVGAVEPVYL